MSAVLAATIGRVAGEKAYLFRLPDDVKKALEAWARDEQRSVNAQLLYVLLQALREAGRWPKPPA
jgi:hypothetical protein